MELQPVARLYYLDSLIQKQIEDHTGIKQPTASKQLEKVRKIGMEYIAAKKVVGNDNNTRKAVIK